MHFDLGRGRSKCGKTGIHAKWRFLISLRALMQPCRLSCLGLHVRSELWLCLSRPFLFFWAKCHLASIFSMRVSSTCMPHSSRTRNASGTIMCNTFAGAIVCPRPKRGCISCLRSSRWPCCPRRSVYGVLNARVRKWCARLRLCQAVFSKDKRSSEVFPQK